MAPLLEENVGEARSSLYLLLASATALLLIGCANVAGLLLARASSRRSELALRAALGAARMRVLRQLMTEAVTLALAGGVLGILISFVLLRAGLSFVPHDLPRVYDVHINGRVMAFTVVLSVGTAFVFGLFPAWGMSRSDPAASLREMGAATTPGRHRHRFQHGLVIAETAIGFALLVVSGLLIRSLVNVLHIEPGFDTAHTVFFDVALTQTRYLDVKKIAFFERLFPQLKAIPGVERVGSAHPLPVHGAGSDFFTLLTIPGRSDSPDHLPSAVWTAATPGYFETLSIPLLRGRVFTATDDDAKAPLVALVNRTFAQQFFPNIDPIGHYFTPRLDHEGELLAARQIVGIVGDTRTRDLWEPYQPQFFLPYAQNATHQRPMVVMRVAGDPKGYENTVRQIVATIDPQAPMFGFETFTDDIARNSDGPRFEAILVSGFGSMALFLAALGLYAVLSYIVSERMRELGMRMSLGASRSNVLRLVLRQGLILAAWGLILGAAISWFARSLIVDALFKVEPLDREVLLLSGLLLTGVSLLAALLPALRAARVDPMRTLRAQ